MHFTDKDTSSNCWLDKQLSSPAQRLLPNLQIDQSHCFLFPSWDTSLPGCGKPSAPYLSVQCCLGMLPNTDTEDENNQSKMCELASPPPFGSTAKGVCLAGNWPRTEPGSIPGIWFPEHIQHIQKQLLNIEVEVTLECFWVWPKKTKGNKKSELGRKGSKLHWSTYLQTNSWDAK